MAENGFPKTVDDVVTTLVEIYRYQGRSDIVELLENSNARIEQTEYDNWNGGTYIYALMLEVPVVIFATIEPKLSEIENGISSMLAIICRDLTNDHLNSVNITPSVSKLSRTSHKAKLAETEVKHIWKESFFRLFLSHVSAHKVTVAKLKNELQLRGVSAFVAHEDIAPSTEWQHEIELALGSMHALAALMTPEFHFSKWTDQEVGFALGRGVLVVPVRLGTEPYGFISKVQALNGILDQPAQIANQLLKTLLNHASTHRHMCKGLAFAFEAADSYINAIELSKIISTIKDFADDEKILIQRACKQNNQVFNAIGVVSRVCSAIGVPEPSKVLERDNLSFKLG